MYSAYCLQNNTYFHVGRNSEDKRKCMEDIMDYLFTGSDDEQTPNINEIYNYDDNKLEYEIGCWEVEIHEHEAPIEENAPIIRRENAIKEIVEIHIKTLKDHKADPWKIIENHLRHGIQNKFLKPLNTMTNKEIANEWNDIFCLEENITVIN